MLSFISDCGGLIFEGTFFADLLVKIKDVKVSFLPLPSFELLVEDIEL